MMKLRSVLSTSKCSYKEMRIFDVSGDVTNDKGVREFTLVLDRFCQRITIVFTGISDFLVLKLDENVF